MNGTTGPRRLAGIPDWLFVSAGFLALSLFVLRDLIGGFQSSVIFGADAYLYLWNIWWAGQAIFQEHASPFFSNWIFYPTGASLLFHSFGLTAIAPFSWLGQLGTGTAGVVLAYNLILLTAFTTTGLAVYLLALQETGSRVGGAFAGVAFAFSADRLSEPAWLDLLSIQYLIFFVLFLLRGLRGNDRALIAAGIFAALTVYNSTTQALFGMILGLCFLATHPRELRALMPRVLWVTGVVLVLTTPLIWELFDALFSREIYWADRILDDGIPSSIDPLGFLLPHHYPSLASGLLKIIAPGAAESLAEAYRAFPNQGLGPHYVRSSLGATPVLLAVVGVATQWNKDRTADAREESGNRRLRFWMGLFLIGAIMSLGPYLYLNGELHRDIPLPYIGLRNIPGFALSRAPYRFITLAQLALAILSAFGVAGTLRYFERRSLGVAPLRGLKIVLILAIAGEFCLAAPPSEDVTHSRFASELANDRRDYAVLYYPLTSPIIGAEQQMWHQVVSGKRLLYGYVARVQKNLGDWARPYHRTDRGVRDQVAYLKRLIAKAPLRIEYLIFIQSPNSKTREIDALILERLKSEYTLVTTEMDDGSNRFKRAEVRSVFFVGDHPANQPATRRDPNAQL